MIRKIQWSIYTIFVIKRNEFVIFVTLNEFKCTLNTNLTIDDKSKFFTYIYIKLYVKYIIIMKFVNSYLKKYLTKMSFIVVFWKALEMLQEYAKSGGLRN